MPHHMCTLRLPLSALLLATTAAISQAKDVDWDVVVYGSTPGGIAAAVAAGQLGMKVALYEPLPMIGGELNDCFKCIFTLTTCTVVRVDLSTKNNTLCFTEAS